MKSNIKILIVDDNTEFVDIIKEYISFKSNIEVLGLAHNGLDAVEMIIELSPDVVLLDIVMPVLDGIGVLEKISNMQLKKRPVVLMLTAIRQDSFIQRALALGAEYYMVKPFNLDILIQRIEQIYNQRFIYNNNYVSKSEITTDTSMGEFKKSVDIEWEITNLMHDIGVPPHILGYKYIRELVLHWSCFGDDTNSTISSLYSLVAQKFDTTSRRVERSIRNAIEAAWTRKNNDAIDSLFGYTINYKRGKPTNSEFLAMIMDKIRLDIR